VDAIIILAVVVLNALLGFFQEYKADKAIQSLKEMA
jgi:Ca2+-transporting ATPase